MEVFQNFQVNDNQRNKHPSSKHLTDEGITNSFSELQSINACFLMNSIGDKIVTFRKLVQFLNNPIGISLNLSDSSVISLKFIYLLNKYGSNFMQSNDKR